MSGEVTCLVLSQFRKIKRLQEIHHLLVKIIVLWVISKKDQMPIKLISNHVIRIQIQFIQEVYCSLVENQCQIEICLQIKGIAFIQREVRLGFLDWNQKKIMSTQRRVKLHPRSSIKLKLKAFLVVLLVYLHKLIRKKTTNLKKRQCQALENFLIIVMIVQLPRLVI